MNDRAWVATRKGLMELRRKGDAWHVHRVSFLGEPVTMLLPPRSDGFMLAALNLGHFGVKLHASNDAGQSWREASTPTYPEQPKDSPGVPWKMVLIWSLEEAGGAIWAGTIPGGLFRSEDRGASWQLVESLWHRPERLGWFGGGYDAPGIHSICPDPRAGERMLIGISCGGAWVTRDAGAQWVIHAKGMKADFMPPEQSEDQNIQDPHRIVRCAAVPDVLWCQHHCGIWRSKDNAASWQRLEAPVSSFGFAVAAHPRDANTAWFVPAVKDECRVPVDGKLVVNRTRDGGRSFETLREGLPQRDCWDLVYRHGLDVAEDGRKLLMGSTTGGVWTSADGGESWAALDARLPPVAAVRIG
jgi:photosystem II stability/assembly factor-like uncharacterized protein